MIERPFVKDVYPDELLEASKRLLACTVNMFGSDPNARNLATYISTVYPWAATLASQEAKKTGCNATDIMLANLSYDLMWGIIGCSTVVKPTKNGPIVARNMDWFPPGMIAQASAVLPTKNGQHAATPGMFGVVTGLSNNGFALILNAAYSGPNNYKNIPMLLFLRQVLDTAENYNDALKMLVSTPLMCGGLITVVGTSNDERAVVERSTEYAAIRRVADDEPLFVTNHFRKLIKPKPYSCDRYEWLIANEGLAPLELIEGVKQEITSQQILISPAEGYLKLYIPDEMLNLVESEDMGLQDFLGQIVDVSELEM